VLRRRMPRRPHLNNIKLSMQKTEIRFTSRPRF
jgi:hypothetical protein